MVFTILGFIFGALITGYFLNKHYEKRLKRAFWEWIKEQDLKGIIDESVINELWDEFSEKTKGIITIEKK